MKPLPLPGATDQSAPVTPAATWLNAFNYVFGYQLKLMQDFWGISRRH